jgi:hypothetical protein
LLLSKSIKCGIASFLVMQLLLVNIMSTAHLLTAHKDETPICNDNEKKAHFHGLNHDILQCNLCDFISNLIFVSNHIFVENPKFKINFSADYLYYFTQVVASCSYLHLRGPPQF